MNEEIASGNIQSLSAQDELFTRKIILVSRAFEVFPDLQTAEKWLTREGVQDKLKTEEGFKGLIEELIVELEKELKND